MSSHEIEVLGDQLDTLLAEGLDDPEEALEVAALAGMLQRRGVAAERLADAEAWRVGPGAALLDEAWDLVDTDAYIEAIDALTTAEASDDEVEESVLDFDELIAAAAWCGRADVVARAAAEVEHTIRMVPEAFASLAADGREMARLPLVAQSLELWGFWLAIADSGEHADT